MKLDTAFYETTSNNIVIICETDFTTVLARGNFYDDNVLKIVINYGDLDVRGIETDTGRDIVYIYAKGPIIADHIKASYLRDKLSRELSIYGGWHDNFTRGYTHAIRYLFALSDKELLRHIGYQPELPDRGLYKGYQAALITLCDSYKNYLEELNA